MRLNRAVLLGAAILAASATMALSSGTEQEQAACRPDVAKHCKTAGTDEMVVLFCLKEHREKLTLACRKVLEDHGQ